MLPLLYHFSELIFLFYRMFDFGGLCKFAEIQDKRYNDESKSLCRTIQTYSSRHGMLLVPKPAAQDSIIQKGADETKSNTINIVLSVMHWRILLTNGAAGKKKQKKFFLLRRTGATKINVQTRIIFLIWRTLSAMNDVCYRVLTHKWLYNKTVIR